MRFLASLIVPLSLVASPAAADWKYAKWGMTQPQVIAASGGAARPVSNASDIGRYGRAFAETTHDEGPWRFQVEFAGSTSGWYFGGVPSGLVSIRFGVASNCEALLPWLKTRYPNSRIRGDEFRAFDGSDEIHYSPTFSRCSFRRVKAARFDESAKTWYTLGVRDYQGSPTAYFYAISKAPSGLVHLTDLIVDAHANGGIRTNRINTEMDCAKQTVYVGPSRDFDAQHREIVKSERRRGNTHKLADAAARYQRLWKIACGQEAAGPRVVGDVQLYADRQFATNKRH